MASKWIKKDNYEKFLKEKEADSAGNAGMKKNQLVWKPSKAGTVDDAIVYKIRMLPDLNGMFYKKVHYHMFKSVFTGKWIYVYCPKTESMDNFCPFCAVTSKLYNSASSADKALGKTLKRGVKYVGNAYIISDPMDEKRSDDEKAVGKVRLFEFGKKVEAIIDTQLKDEDGIGSLAFDPEEGRDFIIRVGKTAKDADGNDYWNYDKTSFASNSKSLGSEKEINVIMESTTDIVEYINAMKNEKTVEDVMKILDAERLSGWIEDELVQLGMRVKSSVSNGNDSKEHLNNGDLQKNIEIDDDKLTDEELLRQLDDLK